MYEDLRSFRNRVVHGPLAEVPESDILLHTEKLKRLVDYLEGAPYIRYLSTLSKDRLLIEADDLISETLYEIIQSDAFSSAMAETNASDFDVDGYEIRDTELRDDELIINLAYTASGQQDEDRMYSGDTIRGKAVAVVNGFRDVHYAEVTAAVYLAPL